MKTKIQREACSKSIQNVNINLAMSEQAFFDLAIQKLTLLKIVSKMSIKEAEDIQGVINFIDEIQDQAVADGFNEDVVFPLLGD